MDCITDIRAVDDRQKMGRMYWPLFGREVPVVFGMYHGVSVEYAQECAAQLLDEGVIQGLLQGSLRYFCEELEEEGTEWMRDIFALEGRDLPETIEAPEELLPYIEPGEIFIEEEIPGMRSVSVEFGCTWGPEHGMQWVARNGKPLFVGAAQGLGSHAGEEVYLSTWRDQNYLCHG